jgi:hypothetical protein
VHRLLMPAKMPPQTSMDFLLPPRFPSGGLFPAIVRLAIDAGRGDTHRGSAIARPGRLRRSPGRPAVLTRSAGLSLFRSGSAYPAAIAADLVQALAQALEHDRVVDGQTALDDMNDNLRDPAFGELDDEIPRPVKAAAHPLQATARPVGETRETRIFPPRKTGGHRSTGDGVP